jgi:predicted site-specific integrase-resolvase
MTAGDTKQFKTAVEDPILSLEEAGKRIGRTRQTIAKWIDEGLIEYVTFPSGMRGIRQSVVERSIQVHKAQ